MGLGLPAGRPVSWARLVRGQRGPPLQRFFRRIINFHQTESLRRGIDAGAQVGITGQEAGDVSDRATLEADLDQGADDDAHHVAKKTAAADIDGDEVGIAPEFDRIDFSHGGAGIATGRAKSRKIVAADKGGGGQFHCFEVEFLTDMPGGAGEGGGANRGEVDLVAVPFAAGGKAGMEVIVSLRRFFNCDIVGEEAINPLAKGDERKMTVRAEVGDHGAGMDAGVGTAGTMQDDLFANDLAEGFFDNLLDRAAFSLALPADIGGAVVFNGQADSSHSGGRIINPRSSCPEKSLVMPSSFS